MSNFKITKEQAVRITYECVRDFRDIAGGCGGTGVPWDDLKPEFRKNCEAVFDGPPITSTAPDELFFRLIVEHLKTLI